MGDAWGTFDATQVAELASGQSFFADPTERCCPSCAVPRLRTYVHAPVDARRPTLVSYVWCSGCRAFAGSRTRHPEGLFFSDPLAALPAGERRALERTVGDFFAHLDALWDAGRLPQTFAA